MAPITKAHPLRVQRNTANSKPVSDNLRCTLPVRGFTTGVGMLWLAANVSCTLCSVVGKWAEQEVQFYAVFPIVPYGATPTYANSFGMVFSWFWSVPVVWKVVRIWCASTDPHPSYFPLSSCPNLLSVEPYIKSHIIQVMSELRQRCLFLELHWHTWCVCWRAVVVVRHWWGCHCTWRYTGISQG